MELGFCAATPILARCPQRRTKRTQCVTRMQIEPNRRGDESHPLLRAPEAIAAMFTVGAALFRDILRGDGDGIRNRLNARLRAQAEQKARSKMLLETQKEVRSLNQAIIREREKAKPIILEKQNMLNRLVETHAIEALANAVTDDEIELPPEGILKGELKEYETEIRQLISKAREARKEFRACMNSNKSITSDKRTIEDIEAETKAADALAKRYQMELKDVNSATKLLEEEKQAEMARLKKVLETHQKRIAEFRKISEQMDEEKRMEEAEALKSKSTPTQEIESEESLREVRKEVNLANKLAKNIVQTATKAVKSAEDGDMKAVDDLGNALKGDLYNAERQMKKSQRNKSRKQRKMRLSAVENVLGMMDTNAKGGSSPASPLASKKKGDLQSSSQTQSTLISSNGKAVHAPSSSLPGSVSAKPSLAQKLEPASTAAAFISDSSPNEEEILAEPKVEDVIEEAAPTAGDDVLKPPATAEIPEDVIDEEILKNEIELALDFEEFEKQKNIVGVEEEEEPPKELLQSIATDLDIIEQKEKSAAPALLQDDDDDSDSEEERETMQNRRRWSADDEMGDLNDSDVVKATDDEEVESEAKGELPNITDGFSIEDLEEDDDIESSDDIENANDNGNTAATAISAEDDVDEGSFGKVIPKATAKTSTKNGDETIELFVGAEGKKERLELLRIIETGGEGVAREGEWKPASSIETSVENPVIMNTEATTEAAVETPKKRRRGRPRKVETDTVGAKEKEPPKLKRRRGRPRKTEATAATTTTKAKTKKESKKDESAEVKPKRKRGRPRKNPSPPSEEPTSK